MYVRPEFRGRGFGKLLLDHLATYAQSNGIDLLRLETASTRPKRFGCTSAPASAASRPSDPTGMTL
jgi:GNAT superfamily N-acetyltransferase